MTASLTADTLLAQVGCGQLHVSVALEIAAAAFTDGILTERIRTLGNMATDSNKERSLHRWLKNLYGHNLQTYSIRMRLHPPDKLIPEEVLQEFCPSSAP